MSMCGANLVASQLLLGSHRVLEPGRRLDQLLVGVRRARVAVALMDGVDLLVERRGERLELECFDAGLDLRDGGEAGDDAGVVPALREKKQS